MWYNKYVMKRQHIPDFFKSVLWSYDIGRMDARDDMRVIVVQTINSGEWKHWRWILRTYGKYLIRHLVAGIPASEFRPEALALASAAFGVKKMKYASRSAYIRAQKSLAKTEEF